MAEIGAQMADIWLRFVLRCVLYVCYMCAICVLYVCMCAVCVLYVCYMCVCVLYVRLLMDVYVCAIMCVIRRY